jgi:chromosome segregation ATPase
MAQRSPNVLGLDDREEQLKIIKALRDEISELEEKERGVDVNLQELLNKQYKLIDDEQQFLTSLSNLKDELALKKIQTKSLNEEINEARKQQDNLYDQLYQYNQSIPEKTSSNEFNTDLIRNTDEESYLIEVHQLLLEQQNDIEKQIENYQHKINLYQDDLKSNEKQIEILQTSKKNLGQELEDRQRQKELKERDLSQSRNNLIERQNDRKRDEQQLRILREKSAQLDYSKTFLKELSKDKQKEVGPILKRFKDELVEIDNRRKTIADEIRTKENDMKDLKKDIESITTIDFTTSSTMSL